MAKRMVVIAILMSLLLLCGCAPRFGTIDQPMGWQEEGYASWYGKQFHGNQTASGEIYDMHQLTAAHRTLAFGTHVRVTNRNNGHSVIVRINDRGPSIKKRIIDLSFSAAKKVDMIEDGVVPVVIQIVDES